MNACISSLFDALPGVMAQVRTSKPSVFCGIVSSVGMMVDPETTADVLACSTLTSTDDPVAAGQYSSQLPAEE